MQLSRQYHIYDQIIIYLFDDIANHSWDNIKIFYIIRYVYRVTSK